MRYLTELNGWLERDTRERQNDMGNMAHRLEGLSNDLANRMGLARE